eukprot:XP_001705798.1 Hypothetical protein GL50803_1441 [Giardia lamblia ATCC 50803]
MHPSTSPTPTTPSASQSGSLAAREMLSPAPSAHT